MNNYDIEKIVHEYDFNIIIDMVNDSGKISCFTAYESITHDFHMKIDTIKELTRIKKQDISKFIGESIILTYKSDIRYLRFKKINRLYENNK